MDQQQVLIQFCNSEETNVGQEIALPMDAKREDLVEFLRLYLDGGDADDFGLALPDYGLEVVTTLREAFCEGEKRDGKPISTESVLKISYYTLSSFKIRPISRMSCSLEGHSGNIVCAQFSSDSQCLATGAGDCEVRLWDVWTNTPLATLKGHTKTIECVAWSADNEFLASGSGDYTVRLWPKPMTTKGAVSIILRGHKATITAMAFKPLHLVDRNMEIATASKDGTIKIWDCVQQCLLKSLDGHTAMCTAIKWSALNQNDEQANGEEGPFLFSTGRDCFLKVWSTSTGKLLQQIKSHGHWINCLSTNTDYALRTGPFNHPKQTTFQLSKEEIIQLAKNNLAKVFQNIGTEKIVTCSDDNTLSLYDLKKSTQPLAKMLGHQKAVLAVNFSPNGRYIASAGCDSSVKLWDGLTGKFITTYRGHVGAVHQIAWSADSYMVCSGSKDTTMKIWRPSDKKKALQDLPGHADEIFAIDWSPDGAKIGSGGRDKKVYIWSH